MTLLGATPGLAFAADAQTASQPPGTTNAAQVETVVVTAQKRAEDIQDVPLSIAAVSGAAMQAKGVTDVADLQKVVPNLSFSTVAQSAGVYIRIRGIGAGSNAAIDPSVAPYLDGVYIPRPGAILSSFLDVDHVEVLRGPQGTLFGRNATVGAISITTVAPSFSGDSAEVSAEGGSYRPPTSSWASATSPSATRWPAASPPSTSTRTATTTTMRPARPMAAQTHSAVVSR